MPKLPTLLKSMIVRPHERSEISSEEFHESWTLFSRTVDAASVAEEVVGDFLGAENDVGFSEEGELVDWAVLFGPF